MKITHVETVRISEMRHGELGYLVIVHTDAGIDGLGEVAADCHPSAVAHCIRRMDLAGLDPMRIEAFWQTFHDGSFWRGGPIWTSAVSGVEQALWDIKGKALGAPVYELVGGAVRDRIKLYTHTRMGNESPEEFGQAAAEAVAEGFHALKFDPLGTANQRMDASEMRLAESRIRATREAAGEDIDILIEGHGRLSPAMAIQMAQRMEPYEPFFFEEPVPPDNVAELARVSASINIPVASGERLYTRWMFRELLESQAVDYIQPDLCHCGGFAEARKIAAMAEVYHIRVTPHNPNGPISTLVGLHLGACTPNFEMLEYGQDDEEKVPLLLHMPEVVDGHMAIPTRPGWGVEVDEDILARFRVESDNAG
jgi:galactonate dehydratase